MKCFISFTSGAHLADDDSQNLVDTTSHSFHTRVFATVNPLHPSLRFVGIVRGSTQAGSK